MSDPAAKWMEGRTQVDTLFHEYSWLRDPAAYTQHRHLLDETLAAFSAQLTLTPHDERLWQQYGHVLLEYGRFTAAKETIQHGLSLPTCDQDTRVLMLYDMARLYAQVQDEGNCCAALQEWRELIPSDHPQREQLLQELDFQAMQGTVWFQVLSSNADSRG